MPISKLRPSFTFTEDRLAELRAVVPEAFADGKVNWDVLREALGERLEDESTEAEHFGLFWPGKRDARRLAAMPSKGTLVPAPGQGVSEDTTRSIFIEGDNLEVLKLLQKSYAGRVKMIYIDPPYNTGNDFVYKDDFRDPSEDYLRKTRQMGDAGELLTSNPKAGGRFHSNWLSMMYPRLRLARGLLREDGAIFVSIDDNEVHNLRQVMNEIFGDENFVALIVAQTNPRGRTLDRYIARTHEYILVFTNASDVDALNQIAKGESALKEYDKQDNDGQYRELELRNRNPVFNRKNRPNLFYPLFVDPHTGEVSLSRNAAFKVEVLPLNSKEEEGCWTWGKEKVARNTGLLLGRQVNTGAWRIFRKDYIPVDGATTKAKSIWVDKTINHENGKEELGRLFGKTPFDFPKSVELIKKCLLIGTGDDEPEIILDFFAGSGTTAQAVLEQNSADGGQRRFVCVQIPEPTENKELPTIAEIGKERIRRAIKQLQSTSKSRSKLKSKDLDLGFRVFTWDRSHFKSWQDYTGDDPQQLALVFENAASPLVDGWEPEKVLTEVQLLEGFPLDSRVTELEEHKKNKVLLVESDACAHRLLVCLDMKIKDDTLERLKMEPDDVFACLDSALTDEAKVRLGDLGNLRVI